MVSEFDRAALAVQRPRERSRIRSHRHESGVGPHVRAGAEASRRRVDERIALTAAGDLIVAAEIHRHQLQLMRVDDDVIAAARRPRFAGEERPRLTVDDEPMRSSAGEIEIGVARLRCRAVIGADGIGVGGSGTRADRRALARRIAVPIGIVERGTGRTRTDQAADVRAVADGACRVGLTDAAAGQVRTDKSADIVGGARDVTERVDIGDGARVVADKSADVARARDVAASPGIRHRSGIVPDKFAGFITAHCAGRVKVGDRACAVVDADKFTGNADVGRSGQRSHHCDCRPDVRERSGVFSGKAANIAVAGRRSGRDRKLNCAGAQIFADKTADIARRAPRTVGVGDLVRCRALRKGACIRSDHAAEDRAAADNRILGRSVADLPVVSFNPTRPPSTVPPAMV